MPPTRFSPMRRGNRTGRGRRALPAEAEPAIEFGHFRVLLRRRQLLADGAPVELGARAFDILLVLIEADGLLVTKEELFDRVWSGRIVDENNLHAQMSALRKVLGSDRNLIRTEFGRGYRVTAALRPTTAAAAGGRITREGRWRNQPAPYGWSGCRTLRRRSVPVSDATAGTVPASSRPSGGNAGSDGSDPRSR
jgi:DNA-binding winged helix-turn-helix (wHTH) protein